jgi:adenine-specific DNA-methyltransferase
MPTLDWIGKKAVVNHHREVPYRLLHCDKSKSVGDPDAGNLLVYGDNLDALKALLPYYAGKVKCIYIDPPYNTGNEGWVYNDNVNSPEIRAWLGKVVGREAEDLSRHDKWLCMMYPRLRLLHYFLSDDGAIFISIDDNEYWSLRGVLDDIFDRKHFVTTIIWQKRTSRENRAAFSESHDYIVIYSKRPADEYKLHRNKLPPNEKGFSNPDGDLRGPWRSIPFSAQGYRENQMYVITTPTGKKLKPPKGRCWGATEPEFEKFQADNRIYFPKAGNGRPRVKAFKGEEEKLVPMTLWMASEVGDNERAKKHVIELADSDQFFDTPKPEQLIARIIEIASNPGDIILDSFSGSGTTGATAEKMGRKFVMIEAGEHAANTIMPRLKKVTDGTDSGGITAAYNWSGGAGFRFCTLGEPLFDENASINPQVAYSDLAAHIFFCETGSPIPNRANGNSPLIGSFRGRAIYLFYAPESMGFANERVGNVLNGEILASLPTPDFESYDGTRVVYAESCTVPEERLRELGVSFKQVPYQIEGL